MNKFVCNVCGEELKVDDKFCPSCGASVDKEIHVEKNATLIENIDIKEPESIKRTTKKKSGKIAGVESKEPGLKNLSVIKLVYLVFGLLLAVFIINYAGGVFEKPAAGVIASNSNLNDIHKGVDLQNLQQINVLDEKIKTNPEDFTSLLELAHLLNDSGFKDRAIEKYKQYLVANPKDADVLVDMGVCYYELGKYNEAINQMKEALKYKPKHQIAHLNLGIVNMTSGNHEEALNWWKKAIEIDPSSNIAQRAQELINSH